MYGFGVEEVEVLGTEISGPAVMLTGYRREGFYTTGIASWPRDGQILWCNSESSLMLKNRIIKDRSHGEIT